MENGNAPASKADLQALEERLTETIRDAQTEVRKAFYGFAESNRQRVAQLEGNQGALITRIGVLEDRMLQLERKINFPPLPPQ
jgi:outer membrane protein TolC